MDKKTLRKQMKELRARASGDCRAAEENLFSLQAVKDAKSVFIYHAFGSEMPTGLIIERCLKEGKTVYLPRVEQEDMVAVAYDLSTPTLTSDYHIQEPTGDAFFGEPDLALVPLLAVNEKGERLGYGGGYYDRYLRDKQTLKIGYCYDFQVIGEVFAEAHDVQMDAVVTDRRIIFTKKEQTN